ncbi:hypothetical protein C7M84_023285 [Penaeus vannamei]|uniref:Uncharacterized protein n=1 Tax=Penaeus vannamei TaxID=6689 RepID=A0A423U4A2_PENVA|nr:hypothetical protein C7M84_023285 [Penaeus vannamei]
MGICQYDSNSPQPEPTPIRQQQSRRQQGHRAANCPFPERRHDQPQSTSDTLEGKSVARTPADSVSHQSGRPIVPINASGSPVLAFVDTGPPSAYLIINKCHLPVHFTDTQSLHVSLVSVPDVFTTELDASAAKCTATAGSLNTTIANKNVVSITSQGEPTVRCLADDMSFQHETDILKTSTTQTCHTQEDQARTLPFDSRHVHVHRATSIPGKAAKFVRCKVSRDVTGDAVVLEAQSGPMFMVPNSVAKVTPQRECDVWVVNLSTRPLTLKNGKKLGNVYGVSEREVGTSDGGEAGSPLLVEESPGLPGISQVEESLVEPEEIEHPSFSEDEFDCAYGLYDFGYEDDHFTIFPDVDLSPSPACAVTTHSQTETVGSLVMRRIPPSVRDGPLGSRWAGPCRIVRKLGPVAFLLEDTAPPNTRRRAHINDLKPYVPPLELDFGPDDPEPEDEPVATTSVSKGKTTPWEESLLDAVRVHQPGRPRSKVTTQLGDVAEHSNDALPGRLGRACRPREEQFPSDDTIPGSNRMDDAGLDRAQGRYHPRRICPLSTAAFALLAGGGL